MSRILPPAAQPQRNLCSFTFIPSAAIPAMHRLPRKRVVRAVGAAAVAVFSVLALAAQLPLLSRPALSHSALSLPPEVPAKRRPTAAATTSSFSNASSATAAAAAAANAIFPSPAPLPAVHILIVTEPTFRKYYARHTAHVRCYARRHGYVFRHLRPVNRHPCNVPTDVRFSKHCTVGLYLAAQRGDVMAVVLDADVVPGAPAVPLTRWVRYAADHAVDFAFYERSWNFEIASGNYLARNTPLAVAFLKYWSGFERAKPPGFSSADNGAIHLAVLEALALTGRRRCFDLYANLTAEVTDLFPYYEFIACARRLLGPAGLYEVRDGGARKGAIAIFPRFFGFVIDAAPFGYMHHRLFYPFHHGIKKRDWEDDYVGPPPHRTGPGGCAEYGLNEELDAAELARRTRINEDGIVKTPMREARVLPRWRAGWGDDACYERLWCAPTPYEAAWGEAFIEQGVRVNVSRLGVDAVNPFVHRAEAGSDMQVGSLR